MRYPISPSIYIYIYRVYRDYVGYLIAPFTTKNQAEVADIYGPQREIENFARMLLAL